MAKKTDEIRQAQFLAEYINCMGSKSKAAKAAGISIDTVKTWCKKPEFAAQVAEAKKDLVDKLIAAGLERAVNKSDLLLMFFLKSFDSEQFDENYRRTKWEQNKEDELRQKYPLPQIQIISEPKLDTPKQS